MAMLIGVLVAVALLAPLLAPYDPEAQHRDFLHAPPMRPHVVATSGARARRSSIRWFSPIVCRSAMRRIGRACASLPWFERRAVASRYSCSAPTASVAICCRGCFTVRAFRSRSRSPPSSAPSPLGALIGGFAGYRGGWIDDVVMRVADFVLILPVIYVALMLRAVMPLVLPPATVFVSMATIFTLLGWPFVAKGVRGIIATEREQEYVAAARSLGASGWHLLSRHLLPACRGFLLAQAALLLPAFVLAEATLSYIGLGFPEHLPTWGTMLIEAASVTAMTRFPWMLAPAAAIFLVVLSANVILQSDKIVRRPI